MYSILYSNALLSDGFNDATFEVLIRLMADGHMVNACAQSHSGPIVVQSQISMQWR